MQTFAENNDDRLMDLWDAVAEQMQNGTFDLLDWYKAKATGEDVTVVTPKCHIVLVRPEEWAAVAEDIFTHANTSPLLSTHRYMPDAA